MLWHDDESVFLRFEAEQHEETTHLAITDVVVTVQNDCLQLQVIDSVGKLDYHSICPFTLCCHLHINTAQWFYFYKLI